MDLDAYRASAEAFLSELTAEYYRHYAGLQDEYAIEPIYARHQELTRIERARAIGLSVDGGAGVRELWRFACEGHIGDSTRACLLSIMIVQEGLRVVLLPRRQE